MTLKFKLFLTGLLLILSCVLFAQENTLLWKISGNGLTKPSYIFGTMHLICKEDYVLRDKVTEALKNSDGFYTEINFADMSSMVSLQKMMVSDIPLSKRISKEKYKKLSSLLQKKLNISIETFELMSDMAIVSTITTKTFPCEDIKLYEIELLQLAMLQNKELGGLETVEEQVKFMEDSMNIDTGITMLENMNPSEDNESMQLSKLYAQEKLIELTDLINKTSYMDNKVYDILLNQRNQNWANNIPELIKNKSIFFGVGAAHLAGEKGILKLLKNQGFTIEPIL
jgi:uncharacterized protein YbaP (TraB family)